MRKIGYFTTALAALLTFGVATESHASLVSCPASFTTDGTAKVTTGTSANATAASLCEYIFPPNNSLVANDTNVNAAGFFGTSTWTVLSAANQVTANATSGSWSIAGANFSQYTYMIVFKDGSGTSLTGFLFNGLSSSGNWFSPFTNPPFAVNSTRNVGHYSIFQATGATPGYQVPGPSTLALLSVGLIAAGVTRRMKKHA